MEVLMGKSSINGQFSMAMLNNQRVCQFCFAFSDSLKLHHLQSEKWNRSGADVPHGFRHLIRSPWDGTGVSSICTIGQPNWPGFDSSGYTTSESVICGICIIIYIYILYKYIYIYINIYFGENFMCS